MIWLLNGELVQNGGLLLKMFNVTNNQSGVLVCMINIESYDYPVKFWSIIVVHDPVDLDVSFGSDISLTCSLDQLDVLVPNRVELIWMYNFTYVFRMPETNQPNNMLYLEHVTVQDSGIYGCIAIEKQHKQTVLGKDIAVEKRRKWLSNYTRLKVKPGKNLRFLWTVIFLVLITCTIVLVVVVRNVRSIRNDHERLKKVTQMRR
ncbi:unnamed protein product [Didymodactylos carnosus]|nr:unnamed protein product [Didymodactylos carnosus]CAF3731678.1 unnamed protein product [Didymodactylos carnosus]